MVTTAWRLPAGLRAYRSPVVRAGLRAGAKPSRMVSSGSTRSSSARVTVRFLVVAVSVASVAKVTVLVAMVKSLPSVAVLSGSTLTVKVTGSAGSAETVTGTLRAPPVTFSSTEAV